MENRVLRNYIVIAREENLTVAANKLHVSQSALSRQIKDLEYELNQKLFTRHNHNIKLTNEGQFLLERAKDIISLVDDTLMTFQNKSDEFLGDIYLGAAEFSSMDRITGILKTFHDQYPHVKLQIFSAAAEGIFRRMDQGIIDYAFLTSPTDTSKYNSLLTDIKEDWGLLMRKDNILASKPYVELEDFKSVPLLISRQVLNAKYSNYIMDWLHCDFSELNLVGTFNLPYNAALMVQHGIGCALSFRNLAYTEDGPLCFRPLEPLLQSSVELVWRKDKKFSEAATLLLNAFQNHFFSKIK